MLAPTISLEPFGATTGATLASSNNGIIPFLGIEDTNSGLNRAFDECCRNSS